MPNDDRAVVSLGDEAIDLAAHAGLELDPWQRLIIREMASTRDAQYYNPFSKRHEPKWAATEYGLIVSRQNGKGSILECRELAGLFLWGERLIIHSAHQFDTSIEAFSRVLFLIENTPDLDALVARVVRSHGEEGIELRNGQRLRFRTRTKGGGRGFTADTVIFDEAMMSLTKTQIGAILPTISARPNGQLIYTGSAGDQESEQLGRIRARALKGDDPSLGFAEWSIEPCGFFCPPDCTEHDDPTTLESAAKANPAFGIRISPEHIEMERRSMHPETYLRERLGVGDYPVEGDGWRVISKAAWDDRGDKFSKLTGKFVLAIDSAPDQSWSAIGVAGANKHNEIHAELTSAQDDMYDYRAGIKWVVPRVLEIWKKNKPEFVVVDPSSPAGTLIPELESLNIKVVQPSSRELAQWCGDFKTGIQPKPGEKATITHLEQPPVTSAVAGADKRKTVDLWRWDKSESASDITPLTCLTMAVGGFKQHVFGKKTEFWAFYA
ncbi:hypothetical protein [Nocardia nova]|uniref:hypothetical protein n=1 Tax=Nocardia nova TaxID=37330 RepID=UPI002738E35B|nr:hypothetical protein [Nocardia nova]